VAYFLVIVVGSSFPIRPISGLCFVSLQTFDEKKEKRLFVVGEPLVFVKCVCVVRRWAFLGRNNLLCHFHTVANTYHLSGF